MYAAVYVISYNVFQGQQPALLLGPRFRNTQTACRELPPRSFGPKNAQDG
jgi:hypothetical protein